MSFILANGYLQKLYEASKPVCYLITIYKEIYSHQKSHQQHLIKVLKLLQYHFLIQDFNLLGFKIKLQNFNIY